ncbi:MAG TPA: hypothetical protein VFU55_12745 [Terracidiphilus sp.]|nr:hypothetical protein [Terracidiphilus sp.]
MTFVRSACIAAALAAATALGHGQSSVPCANATLNGDYAFTVTGQILAPAPAAGVVAGVTMTHFNASGTFTQVDHVVHAGIPPVEEWRPGSGIYHINPDCTGYMVIYAQPANPADASPPLRLEIVVTHDGNLIRTVVSGSPASSLFEAAITSTGTRAPVALPRVITLPMRFY